MIDILKVLLGVVVGILWSEWRDHQARKREEHSLGTMITIEVWLLDVMISKDIENTLRVIDRLKAKDGHPSLGRHVVKNAMPIYEANLNKLAMLPKQVISPLILLHDFVRSVSARTQHLHEMFDEFYSENVKTSLEDLLVALERQKEQFGAIRELCKGVFPILAEKYWTKAEKSNPPSTQFLEAGFRM